MANSDIFVGAVFETFNMLEMALNHWEHTTGTNLIIAGSHSVSAYNKRILSGHLKESLRYSWVNYRCKHGGPQRRFKEQRGIRWKQSQKFQCPLLLKVKSISSQQCLIVENACLEHAGHPYVFPIVSTNNTVSDSFSNCAIIGDCAEQSLRRAAACDDIKVLHSLLNSTCSSGKDSDARKVNINAPCPVSGWTALHWAARLDRFQVARLLLQAGADCQVAAYGGEKPADVARGIQVKSLFNTVHSTSATPPLTDHSTNESGGRKRSRHLKRRCAAVSSVERVSESDSKKRSCAETEANKEEEEVEEVLASHATTDKLESSVSSREQQLTLVLRVVNDRPTFVLVRMNPSNDCNAAHQQQLDAVNSSRCSCGEELVILARLANSANKDFVQVSLDTDPSRCTFHALKAQLCAELHLDAAHVSVIRRLPNVLVRNDADVHRLRNEDCLEVEIENG